MSANNAISIKFQKIQTGLLFAIDRVSFLNKRTNGFAQIRAGT